MALATKLLILPCSQSKNGAPQEIKVRSIDEFIGSDISDLLHQSRQVALQRPQTSFDSLSSLIPGLFRYSGTMYSVEGFRDALRDAVGRGMHVLVESGGYGLIRIEEPIRCYEAPIARTAPIWKSVLPRVLADYVLRNQIDEVFVAGSNPYVSVLRRQNWWGTAKCHWFISYLGRGNGNAYQIVPLNIGIAVRDLIQSNCQVSPPWITT